MSILGISWSNISRYHLNTPFYKSFYSRFAQLSLSTFSSHSSQINVPNYQSNNSLNIRQITINEIGGFSTPPFKLPLTSNFDFSQQPEILECRKPRFPKKCWKRNRMNMKKLGFRISLRYR